MKCRWIVGLFIAILYFGCSDGKETTEPVVSDTNTTSVPDSPGSNDKSVQDGATPGEVPPQSSDQAGGITNDSAKSNASLMTVTSGGLNVRGGPGMQHAPVRVLPKGSKISVESCTGNWCRISEGEFVSKKFLSEAL